MLHVLLTYSIGTFALFKKHEPFNTKQRDDQAGVHLMEQEHRFLALNINNVPCQNAILNFVEYAIGAALLVVPGMPLSLATLVADTLVALIPVTTIAGSIDALISNPSPTFVDIATTFTSIIAILTAPNGPLTLDKASLCCVRCISSTRLPF